jgi:hypothetical protein
MKKPLLMLAVAALTLTTPLMTFAAMDHGGHDMHAKDAPAHEEEVDGVKATFRVMGIKEHMQAMKMEMPKELKETHHLAVEFKDAKSGKALTEGEVKVKVQNPDKSDQTREMMGMQGHFGADFDFSKKGKYGIMCKFLLKDGKTRQAKFWYTVK